MSMIHATIQVRSYDCLSCRNVRFGHSSARLTPSYGRYDDDAATASVNMLLLVSKSSSKCQRDAE